MSSTLFVSTTSVYYYYCSCLSLSVAISFPFIPRRKLFLNCSQKKKKEKWRKRGKGGRRGKREENWAGWLAGWLAAVMIEKFFFSLPPSSSTNCTSTLAYNYSSLVKCRGKFPGSCGLDDISFSLSLTQFHLTSKEKLLLSRHDHNRY